MEKNICKRIVPFLSADDITDEFKFKLCENLTEFNNILAITSREFDIFKDDLKQEKI